ncbi:MAG: molybdenum ABC transporter ATP-binding protein [Parahaliea sp.]
MSDLRLKLACEGSDGFRLRIDESLPLQGVTAVYGPSGCGKTTLLECIAGLRQPAPGSQVVIDSRRWLDDSTNLPPWQREVGYVFQDARLFPHLDVAGNLAYGQRRRGDSGPDLTSVSQWLGLADMERRMPDTLSAGQRQRVAIGRALLSAPRLLLDEPLANLDSLSRSQCLDALRRVIAARAVPMLYVSHDIEEIAQVADRLLLLEQGRVVDRGPLLELCSRVDSHLTRDEQAAAILLTSLSGHDHHFDLSELAVEGQSLWVNPLSGPVGSRYRVRIPARDVSLCLSLPTDTSILNILPVTITAMAGQSEARVLIQLALGKQRLLARITRKSATALNLRIGDRLYAQIKSTALLSDMSPPP